MKTKFYLMALIAICLLSCSNERTQPAIDVSSPSSASIETALVSNTPMLHGPLKVVGCFSNVDSNGEHEWGFTLDIWRQGDQIYGLFAGGSTTRLVGDPPTGVLVEQVYDRKTGRFSFKSKFPYNTFSFEGVITETVVTGKLVDLSTNADEKIVLTRSKSLSEEMMVEYESYEKWKAYADKILKRRGPKT